MKTFTKYQIAFICIFLMSSGMKGFSQTTSNELFYNPEAAFSGSMALCSHYYFRGVSESKDLPALQFGFDYQIPLGIYIGNWTSTVTTSNPIESDFFTGIEIFIFEELKIRGQATYIYYPWTDSLNSTGTTIELSLFSFASSYNYNFRTKGHYIDFGVKHFLSENLWSSVRSGVYIKSEKAASINDSYSSKWDIDIKIGYSISRQLNISANFIYHSTEDEGFNASINYKF